MVCICAGRGSKLGAHVPCDLLMLRCFVVNKKEIGRSGKAKLSKGPTGAQDVSTASDWGFSVLDLMALA